MSWYDVKFFVGALKPELWRENSIPNFGAMEQSRLVRARPEG